MSNENTQSEQGNQEALDFSPFITGAPKAEPKVVETPKDETQQPIQEVPTEPLVKADEPSKEPFDAAKHYQSIADKRLAELEREKMRREQVEAELNQFKAPKVEVKEPPKRPVFPARPKDYDPTEAVTNPDSVSYKFERDKEDYYSQKDAYDAYKENELYAFKGQIEAKEQAQLKSEQEIAFQTQMLSQIQQAGGVDVNEAKEIWDTYTAPKDDASFLKELVEFHHFKKGQKTPQMQNKIDQFNKNGQRQAQYLPPPGVAPSQVTPEEPSFGDALLQVTKQYRL